VSFKKSADFSWTEMAGQFREAVANHPGFEMARTGDRKGAAFFRTGSNREISQSNKGNGYLQVRLGDTVPTVHRLISEQGWLGPKPGPEYEVDHKNHDRADNSLENLRWVTPSDNSFNRAKSSVGNRTFDFVKELPPDAMIVDRYNGHSFSGYHFSPSTNSFFRQVDEDSFRVLQTCLGSQGSTPYVWCIADDGKQRKINVRLWRLRHGLDLD
jgi:hypothetical protein